MSTARNQRPYSRARAVLTAVLVGTVRDHGPAAVMQF